MSIINFYYLNSDNQVKTACQLLEKCYISKLITLVRVENEIEMEHINDLLWTFSQKSFIPHGSPKDPMPEVQPIYITNKEDNPINAKVLMLFKTMQGIDESFERVIVLLDGKNEDCIKEADLIYEKLRAAGNEMKRYEQTDNGKWVQFS